jgi:hypothetical protein
VATQSYSRARDHEWLISGRARVTVWTVGDFCCCGWDLPFVSGWLEKGLLGGGREVRRIGLWRFGDGVLV